jgi:hypothetical protein
MHELFRLDQSVPVPPGTSPFHVRGIYYTLILQHARSLPGGMDQFFSEVPDVRVREFMNQPFKFMNWYDAFPTLPCQVALNRIRGGPFEEFIRERARLSMQKLLPSMFRTVSKLAGPAAAACHASRLLQHYYDFLQVEVSNVSHTEGHGGMSGVPLYLAPVTINGILGLIAGALESLGASDIRTSYLEVGVTGKTNGFDTVSCRVHVRWKRA